MGITIIGGTVTKARNATYINKKTGEKTVYDSKGTARKASSSSKSSGRSNSSGTGVYDVKTGRELSPFEVSGLAPQSTTTGETAYYETGTQERVNSSRSSSSSAPNVANQSTNVINKLKADRIKPDDFVTPKPKSVFDKSQQELASERKFAAIRANRAAAEAEKQRIRTSGTFKERIALYREEFPEKVKTKAYNAYNYYAPAAGVTLFAATAPANVIGKGASAVGKGVKTVISPAVSAYSSALSSVGSSAARFGINLAASTAATYGVTKGVSAAGKAVTGSQYRSYFGSKGEQGLAEQAYKAGVSSSLAGEKGATKVINRAASNVPILDAAVIDKQRFESGVRSFAAQQGLNKAETENLVIATNKYANIRRASFGAGLASANTFSEIGGQVAFAKSGVSSFSNKRGVFTYAAGKIAPQGVIEGSSSVIAEQAASGKNFRTINYGSVALGGAIGGVSAGVIGGGIVASQTATTKAGKFAGKALIAGSNVADPYEVVGDTIAGFGNIPSTNLVKTTGTITLTPVNTATQTQTTSTTQSKSVASALSQSRSKISQSRKAVGLPSPPTSTFTPSPSSTPTITKTRSFTTIKPSRSGSYTPTPTPTPSSSFTPTPTPTPTPTAVSTPATTPSNTFTPANTFTETFVNTRTSVSTRTTTSVPIKTFTPDVPLLPFFPKGGGFGGFGRKKLDFGKKFYTPSATAAFFGIKGSKPTKSSIKSGLGFRPIISSGKGGSLFGSAKF